VGKRKDKAQKRLAAVPGASAARKKTATDPKLLLPGSELSEQRMCWRFEHVDHEGRFGFDKVDGLTLRMILERLAAIEKMTMHELRNTAKLLVRYDLPSPKLCKEARDRLAACGWDDMTSIHRLRIMQKQRLYGFLDRNVFHVVWWDPEHEVWPWEPPNT
jgi:hypothetical protein